MVNKLSALLKWDPERDTTEGQRDIFATINIVAGLYQLIYGLARPNSQTWDPRLTLLSEEILRLGYQMNIIREQMTLLLAEINKLPTVMRAVVDEGYWRNNLIEAKGILQNVVLPKVKTKARFSDEVDQVKNALDKILGIVGGFDIWYEDNPKGPVNYLLAVTPILIPVFQIYNDAQIISWEKKPGNAPENGKYPLQAIPNFTELRTVSLVVKSYETIIENTEKIIAENEAPAAVFIPYTAYDSPTEPRVYAKFANGQFFDPIPPPSGDLPPDTNYLDYYSGIWLSDQQNPDVHISSVSLQYHGVGYFNNHYKDAWISAALCAPPEEVKNLAIRTCRARRNVREIAAVKGALENMKESLANLKKGEVWAPEEQEVDR